MSHVPVLYDEVLDNLQPYANGTYLDATVGAGGHTNGLLNYSAPHGRVLALDKDPDAVRLVREKLATLSSRVTIVQASYINMETVAQTYKFNQFDGILLDLGLSSRQLDEAKRGFSFRQTGPLDMRFDPTSGKTAADLINSLSEGDLADIFWRYGEERFSRQIARIITQNRPIETTTQLANLITQHIKRSSHTHPATRIFQALRIAVNDELQTVEEGIKTAVRLLKKRGRIAVISFHSLEDRIVKQYFRRLSMSCVCPPKQPVCTCETEAVLRLITRKAIKPSNNEVQKNPRCRSARLRVAEKLI